MPGGKTFGWDIIRRNSVCGPPKFAPRIRKAAFYGGDKYVGGSSCEGRPKPAMCALLLLNGRNKYGDRISLDNSFAISSNATKINTLLHGWTSTWVGLL